jgi:hypothetical protein
MRKKAEPKMTITKPDLSKVIPWSEFLTLEVEDPEETECDEEYYSRATSFVESHSFCRGIKETYVGMLYCKIFAVFLFKILPTPDVREWVWAIVGDIPPAVLPIAVGQHPAMALDVYLGEMQRWVDAVDEGKSVEDLLPVNVAPTKEWADELRWRLEFIGENVLMAEYRDELGYDPDEQEDKK